MNFAPAVRTKRIIRRDSFHSYAMRIFGKSISDRYTVQARRPAIKNIGLRLDIISI